MDRLRIDDVGAWVCLLGECALAYYHVSFLTLWHGF